MNTVITICTRCGGYPHDIVYITHDETCSKHEGMLFHKGGVCDTQEIQGKSRELLGLSYIGHSDLHNTYYGISCVWYTLGGSRCSVRYASSKKSNCTLTGSC